MFATATSSEVVVASATNEPETVAPSLGAVKTTDGGLLSIAVLLLEVSAKGVLSVIEADALKTGFATSSFLGKQAL